MKKELNVAHLCHPFNITLLFLYIIFEKLNNANTELSLFIDSRI